MGWQRLNSDERGIGLVELLVVMLLLTIVGAVTVSGLVAGFRATTHAEHRIQALTSTQNTLANIGREIRAADSRDVAGTALLAARPDRLEFDILRDGARWRFVLTVDGTDLTEQRTVWANAEDDPATTSATSTSSRVLTQRLTNLGTQPVFAFFDEDGDCLTGCEAPNGTLLTAPLDADGLAEVTDVALTVFQTVEADRPPIEVSTRIVLRNAGL